MMWLGHIFIYSQRAKRALLTGTVLLLHGWDYSSYRSWEALVLCHRVAHNTARTPTSKLGWPKLGLVATLVQHHVPSITFDAKRALEKKKKKTWGLKHDFIWKTASLLNHDMQLWHFSIEKLGKTYKMKEIEYISGGTLLWFGSFSISVGNCFIFFN